MRVRFKSNLGSRDALALGLDYRECTAGTEVDFDNRLAETLIQRGHVSPVETKSTKVKTVPPKVQTTEKPVEVTASYDKAERSSKPTKSDDGRSFKT